MPYGWTIYKTPDGVPELHFEEVGYTREPGNIGWTKATCNPLAGIAQMDESTFVTTAYRNTRGYI